ncbi:DUF4097 family beta strand repeat-containing protein [Actinomadura hibisca]|uniref:DUF4097 family beta strand repeat-containing protein n=1 Tax=Actinomadura hibisca TaxID=68565 RepID=UPI0008322F5A|nr:DUF4097 family beta strand repeat-containing protein [Actinomadura hibisca]
MTVRTLTTTDTDRLALNLEVPAGTIQVTAEPGRRTAEVRVTALGDDPAVAAAVRDAHLTWDAERGELAVKIPPMQGGATTIRQSFGTVTAGATVVGAVISGDLISIGNAVGGLIIVNGQTVAGGSIEIDAYVPEGAALTAVTGSASLTATGEYGPVVYKTTSGDLTVGGARLLNARSTSGDVRAEVVDGRAIVGSVSGNVRIGRCDHTEVTTTSGDITLADFGGYAELTSVSGDITAHATEGARITARAVSGDVHITATATALAEGLHTAANSVSGRVTSPTGQTDQTGGATRTRRPRRTTGGAR